MADGVESGGTPPTRENSDSNAYSKVLSRFPEAYGSPIEAEKLCHIVQDLQKEGMLNDVASKIDRDYGGVVRGADGSVKQLNFSPNLFSRMLYSPLKVDIKDSGQVTVNGKSEAELHDDSTKFSKDFITARVDSKERRLPNGETVPLNENQKEVLKKLETSILDGDMQAVSKVMKDYPDYALWKRLIKEVPQDIGRDVRLATVDADFEVRNGKMNFLVDGEFDPSKIQSIRIQALTREQDTIFLSRSGSAAASRIPDGGSDASPRIVVPMDFAQNDNTTSKSVIDRILTAGRDSLALDLRIFTGEYYAKHPSILNSLRIPSLQAITDADNLYMKEHDPKYGK